MATELGSPEEQPNSAPMDATPARLGSAQEVATGYKIRSRIIYHEKSFLEFYLLANNSTIDRHRKTPVSREENL